MIVNRLFGKHIDELKLVDLENYFSEPKEESNLIEYKSYVENINSSRNDYREKERTILKTICAFLNSNGGVIIWGAPREIKNEEGNKVYYGGLTPIDKRIKKDDFISKIINRIIPVPSNVYCKIFEIGKDRSILIIEIESSSFQPHQFENKYFMRSDGQTNIAPHHYIEALFKQIKYPDLRGFILFERVDFNDRDIKSYNTQTGQPFLVEEFFYLLHLRIVLVNMSAFINEEDLFFRLSCNFGDFIGEIKDYTSPIHPEKIWGNYFSWKKIREQFHYGDPFRTEITLKVKKGDFIDDTPLRINLSFGGKKAPIKISSYGGLLTSVGRVSEFVVNTKVENIIKFDQLSEKFDNENEYLTSILK